MLGQAAELADSQIGRARGDLQYRLAEATRQLVADLRRQQGQRHLAQLAERERALRAVLSRLASD